MYYISVLIEVFIFGNYEIIKINMIWCSFGLKNDVYWKLICICWIVCVLFGVFYIVVYV